MSVKKKRKPVKRKAVSRKTSAEETSADIHPEEEHQDAQDESGTENDEQEPAANGTFDDTNAEDEERGEERFHKLKGKYKKHPRIDESAVKDVSYHSPGGKNSRMTGSSIRRRKSQF